MENIYRLVLPSEKINRYVRRFMVADAGSTINFSTSPNAIGYNYLNWVIRGNWTGRGTESLDSDDPPMFFTVQIIDHPIFVSHSGPLRHVLVEFTAARSTNRHKLGLTRSNTVALRD